MWVIILFPLRLSWSSIGHTHTHTHTYPQRQAYGILQTLLNVWPLSSTGCHLHSLGVVTIFVLSNSTEHIWIDIINLFKKIIYRTVFSPFCNNDNHESLLQWWHLHEAFVLIVVLTNQVSVKFHVYVLIIGDQRLHRQADIISRFLHFLRVSASADAGCCAGWSGIIYRQAPQAAPCCWRRCSARADHAQPLPH